MNSFSSCTAEVCYLGNSEKNTGNWCFKDGTISFQEIFHLFRRTCPDKVLSIRSDCSYSGRWARDCAKTLDSIRIPPCGHRARERGAMVVMIASCQPDQEAAEPCYSIHTADMTVSTKEISQQKLICFDSTTLVCCGAPDTPCPKTTFRHLTWENAFDRSWNAGLITRREGGKVIWHYYLLHQAGDDYHQEFLSQLKKNPSSVHLSDWGYILQSGEGEKPPQQVKNRVEHYISVS